MMNFLRTSLLTALLVFVSLLSFSQRFNPNTGSIVWDLGPNDPQVSIKLGTKGINIGGYEDVAPLVTNNFGDTLLVKIEFRITDLCGETKTYTTNSKTLKPHETWAPSPFFEGYSFNTSCKKFAEFGSGDKKSKTRIQRIGHTVLILRNLTNENRTAREEKARKAREMALKKQQEEEAKAKAAKEKAEKEKAAKELAAKEQAAREQAAKEKAEQERRHAESNRSTHDSGNTSTQTTQGGGGYQSGLGGQPDAAAQQRQQEIAERQRAAAEAEDKANDERHAEAVRNHQLALQRQKEYELRMEQQRQQQLQQNRQQFNRDAQVAEQAKEEVDNLQRIDMNHRNIEQMEQEYAEKLAQLNRALNNMEQANQQKWNSAVDATDWGTESYSPEMSELMKTTGAMVNSMGEAKRAREARENLAWQREQFLRQVEAEKAQMRLGMRKEMLNNFAPFRLPQTREEKVSRAYGFYVLYNDGELAAERASLSVSNIAEVGTYSDGTWPSALHFHHVAQAEKPRFANVYFHSNGYATHAEAEQMKQALIGLFSKDGTVTEVFLDGNINPSHEPTDFWEVNTTGQ